MTIVNNLLFSGDKDFLKKLVKFQQENPRGKSVTVQHTSNNDVVAALRSDGEESLLIVANFGNAAATFSPEALNISEKATGKIVLATPSVELPPGNATEGDISISPLSGVIIKLDNKKSE